MSLLSQASLCVTPSAYKEGKLYSVIPSDGSGDMSVVRATTATRVNSAGLVELVPYNLLSYSEQFDNAAWPVQDSAVVTANTTTAPNGTTTADTISFDVTPISSCYQSVTNGAGTFTFSIYAKCASGTQSFKFIMYNPTDGQIDSTIFTVTTEWQRFQYSFTVTQNSNWFIANANDGVIRSIFIWGAQLVEGSVAKDYQKTETRLNIPRLDYSNGTCPSLLVEPQRTNLLTYSSSFDNAAWVKLNVSVTANSVTSPSGIQDADSLTENTANTEHVIYRNGTGTSNTFSFYAKANGRNWVAVLSNDGTFTFFDIANGTLGTVASTSTATIVDAGNGWYRCTIYNSHVTFGASIYLSTGNGIIEYLGDGTSGAYIWGAQLEVGSYPTSYIPTTSASVTRNADVISKTGISSLINSEEGVLYAEIAALANDLTNRRISINDNSTTNSIALILKDTSNLIGAVVRVGGSVVADISATVSSQTSINKCAIKFKANNFALWINGVEVGTDLSGSTFSANTLTKLSFDRGDGNDIFYGKCKNLIVFPSALTNDELERLTGTGFNTYAEMANYYNYITQ